MDKNKDYKSLPDLFPGLLPSLRGDLLVNLRVGAACLNEIPQICALEKECFSTPWSEEQFRKAIEGNAVFVFTASLDNLVLGYLVVYCAGGLQKGGVGGELEILNLAVRSDYRRCGIAKCLLSIILQDEYKQGIVRIVLEVRAGNLAAQSLYSSFGFEKVGLRRCYYSDNNEDAIIMACDLPSS